MNIRPALGFGAFALAAVVGAAFALNAMIGTPTAHASGPDRELGEGWTYEPPAADGAAIQCWVVIKDSNVEGTNICSPGAEAKSIEKRGGYANGGGSNGGSEGPEASSDTTVCHAEGVFVQQQCDVDGDAEQTLVVLGFPLFPFEPPVNGFAPASEPNGEYPNGDGGSSGDTTVCAAEGEFVQQQCDVDGDAEQTMIVLPFLGNRGPIEIV